LEILKSPSIDGYSNPERLTMLKNILLIAAILTFATTYQVIAQKLTKKVKVENTDFKKGYKYAAFAVNDDYLAWVEAYTGQFYIYNLETKEVEIVKQKKGRGPHEYIIISSLGLTEDNKLIINDPENIKVIIYNIRTGEFEQDVKFNKMRPYRVAVKGNFIFSFSLPPAAQSLYYRLNVSSWERNAIDMIGEGNHNKRSSTFKRVGYVAAKNNYGIHLTRYYPNIYVINFNEERVQKEIEFDKAETQSSGTTTARGGKKRFMAPLEKNVDILSTDVAFMPGSDRSVMILAEGKGEQRNYDPSRLRVYNFLEERFTNTLDLGVKATEITVNDNYLFVYSEEENEIFQYELIPSE